MSPPLGNSSCDPPCLAPKSFCGKVREAPVVMVNAAATSCRSNSCSQLSAAPCRMAFARVSRDSPRCSSTPDS